MHENEACRIVVTGVGLCTPLGPDRESSWREMLEGRSVVRWLTAPHWTEPTNIAGAAVCFPEQRPFYHPEPLIELAQTTATEALSDSRLDAAELKKRSVGIVYGTSKGGLHTFSKLFSETRRGHSTAIPMSRERSDRDQWRDVLPNRAAAAIAEMIGGYGPVLCPIAACATGLAACLRGAELIQAGDCDVVVAGSADASLQPALLGSFRRLGVLSRETTNPAIACRPFDRHRSGFAIGEGAACLILERLESAMARQAHCYAEWLGGRMFSDATSLTQLDPAGTSLRRLLHDLRDKSESIPDYINLHGTGTATNDLVESQAIRDVFRDQTDLIDCSSLKGGMGHLLGAAGSVELAATVLALRDQIVPPTVNLIEPDPACRLNLTPRVAKPRRIEQAWKLSMGFGGHIAGACLRQIQ